MTPTLWSGTTLPNEEILRGYLPFVLKANFGNNKNLFCLSEKDLDYRRLVAMTCSWLNGPAHIPLCHEKWYDKIKRCLLIEPYLTKREKPPMDYKVFCFHGKPVYIQVDTNRFTDHRRDFYDPNWIFQRDFSLLYPTSGTTIQRPKHLPEMLQAASILSSSIDFIRIDFYCIPELRFGEFTFAPDSGWGKFSKSDIDLELGYYWK